MNDICRTQERQAMALARTENPQTSKDAAKKMVESGALSRQEQWVYEAIKEYVKCHTREDFTTKDIALFVCNNSYHKDYDICRRRFSGLHWKGKIEPIIRKGILTITGRTVYERRDGCRVWRLK